MSPKHLDIQTPFPAILGLSISTRDLNLKACAYSGSGTAAGPNLNFSRSGPSLSDRVSLSHSIIYVHILEFPSVLTFAFNFLLEEATKL
jgi:hypothetical protein